jgi:hypothetical protein
MSMETSSASRRSHNGQLIRGVSARVGFYPRQGGFQGGFQGRSRFHSVSPYRPRRPPNVDREPSIPDVGTPEARQPAEYPELYPLESDHNRATTIGTPTAAPRVRRSLGMPDRRPSQPVILWFIDAQAVGRQSHRIQRHPRGHHRVDDECAAPQRTSRSAQPEHVRGCCRSLAVSGRRPSSHSRRVSS